MMIKARGVKNVEQFFEIKITDTAQCKNLLSQFNNQVKLIMNNLRIQNDQMVVLKPKPKVTEQSDHSL